MDYYATLLFLVVVIVFSMPAIQDAVERFFWKQEKRAQILFHRAIFIVLFTVILFVARVLSAP